jgi:hypothetical protein
MPNPKATLAMPILFLELHASDRYTGAGAHPEASGAGSRVRRPTWAGMIRTFIGMQGPRPLIPSHIKWRTCVQTARTLRGGPGHPPGSQRA